MTSTPLHFELRSTGSLTGSHINAIIALKMQHWPYPPESQIRWFAQNVAPHDRHVLAWAEDALLGYLRIVQAQGAQEAENFTLALVDTVCIDRAHQKAGLGVMLMAAVNRAIEDTRAIGLLACMPSLVAFYKRCGWTTFSHPVTVVGEKLAKLLPRGHSVMVHDPKACLRGPMLRVSASNRRSQTGGQTPMRPRSG